MSLSFPRPAKSLAWFESLLAKQGAVGAGSKLEKGVGAETAIGSFVSYRKDALHCRGGGKYLILHDRDTLELLREARWIKQIYCEGATAHGQTDSNSRIKQANNMS